jgi:glyoxylase-like metal-dependent hydrolase (beta-lactamase superfamily II)/predicted enzyme related to lactoylglutathione lyase
MKVYAVFLLAMFFMAASCRGPQSSGDLVQPDKWWSVHPRPVYDMLEKVATFEEWFDVYRLTEGTYAIYEPNQFEEAISYLLLGRDKAALIDTGTGIGDIRAVVESLTDLPVVVVLTHEHYDHVAGAWRFEEIVHYDNTDALGVLNAGRNNESLQRYLADDYLWKPLPKDFDRKSWVIPPVIPTKLVKEGDIVSLGERDLEVIYTPGHSPGQMCLLDKKNRLLFSGDHFFPGPLYAYSEDVCLADYVDSNRKLEARLGEFDYLCSGHNDPWVKSEVIPRVTEAFVTIFGGGGDFDEKEGLRRYRFDGFDILIQEEDVEKGLPADVVPRIDANLVFLYYRDLGAAKEFYGDVLGLELILDYGFAALYQMSESTIVGLVDEARGMHSADEPKTVTLSFYTNEIDEWYDYLKEKGVAMRGPVRDASRHATRGFVAYDPEGYYLEFEKFLDDPENEKLHDWLVGAESVCPVNSSGGRPDELGILASVFWLYYEDLAAALRFYEEVMGAGLLVDQGFAKVCSSSSTGFIGLVDGAEGLHQFTEEKAVTLAFITEDIDVWYDRLKKIGLAIRDEVADQSGIPVRTFVTKDIAGYFLEFDRFLNDPRNSRILEILGK